MTILSFWESLWQEDRMVLFQHFSPVANFGYQSLETSKPQIDSNIKTSFQIYYHRIIFFCAYHGLIMGFFMCFFVKWVKQPAFLWNLFRKSKRIPIEKAVGFAIQYYQNISSKVSTSRNIYYIGPPPYSLDR